jgi:hypothetical protein
MSRGVPQRDAACGEAGSERSQQRARRQPPGTNLFKHEQDGGGRHIAVIGDNLPFVVERTLVECKRGFQRTDDLGAAGVADEPVDVRHRDLHARENLDYGGLEMRLHEVRDGAAEDNPKPFRIDTPAHDAERIGPKVLAGILDLRRAAIARPQHDRGCTVAEQADGDNIGLGEFVVTKRKRAQFNGHQQHIRTRSRLSKARSDRQTRGSAGAAETEHRHTRHIGPEIHSTGNACLQARRCDSSRAHGDDGIDIAAGELCAGQGFPGDVDEQRLGAFEKGFGAFRPASRFEIPIEWFHGMPLDNSSVRKNAGKPLEVRKARPERVPGCGQHILLQKYVWRDRCRQRNESSGRHRVALMDFRHQERTFTGRKYFEGREK